MRILLVDDEKAIRQFLGRLLEEFNHSVETAADGVKALQALEKETFDLVLTDLRMPEMSGMELLREIQEQEDPPPVVLLTAYADLDTALEAFQLGAADFINKPVRPSELRSRLERINTEKQLREALEQEKEQRIRAETAREMVTTLAHELSNPLMTIMGNADYLRARGDAESPDDCREALGGIRESCERMERVVRRLQNIDDVKTREYVPGQLMVDAEKSHCSHDAPVDS